jgi:gamma-glutamylcyclotransferase (GGCT)/AIG2-like uncharacterized protein YtfP
MVEREHLFVYGTLMPGNPAHALLAPHVEEARPAWTPGRLYGLPAGYPGLVDRAEGQVHGLLLTLRAPVPWTALDEYEGYDVEDPLRSLYLRRLRPVHAEDERLEAYCYVMPESAEAGIIAAGARVLASGRWTGNAEDPAP